MHQTLISYPHLLSPGKPYSSLTVGVPQETFPDECRVALTPQNTALLLKKGFSKVLVEKSAGLHAQFLDEQYKAAGATVVDRDEVFAASDILLKVRPPLAGKEVERVKEGGTVISFLYPKQNAAVIDTLAAKNATAFGMEMIPRISRAQVFDALRYAWSSPSQFETDFLSVLWLISRVTRLSWRQLIILVAF